MMGGTEQNHPIRNSGWPIDDDITGLPHGAEVYVAPIDRAGLVLENKPGVVARHDRDQVASLRRIRCFLQGFEKGEHRIPASRAIHALPVIQAKHWNAKAARGVVRGVYNENASVPPLHMNGVFHPVIRILSVVEDRRRTADFSGQKTNPERRKKSKPNEATQPRPRDHEFDPPPPDAAVKPIHYQSSTWLSIRK